VTSEREQIIVRRKIVTLIVYVSLFVVAQISFLILYGIMSRALIQVYQNVPQDIDQASKLIVQPNLQIASIFTAVPQNVLDKYAAELPPLLSQPSQSIPGLFPLLQLTPCANCTYLYPLLSTNFISFYSSFNQLVAEARTAKASQKPSPINTTELYYALDIVTSRIQ
jgi:predicted PurR-regulated permease PerM